MQNIWDGVKITLTSTASQMASFSCRPLYCTYIYMGPSSKRAAHKRVRCRTWLKMDEPTKSAGPSGGARSASRSSNCSEKGVRT